MSFKDIINKNVDILKTAFSKQTQEPIIAGLGENTSSKNIVMRQDPPEKRGLKRNAIIAISAGVGVIAVTMIVSGLLSPNKADKHQVVSEAKTDNIQSPASGLPDKYTGLPNNESKNNMKAGTQQQQTNPRQDQVNASTSTGTGVTNRQASTYRPSQIEDTGYRSTGYNANNSTSNETGYTSFISNDSKPVDYIASAIRFAFGDKTASAAAANNSENASGAGTGSGAVQYNQAQPNTLFAGTVIPASLITGIVSGTSGDIVAQVRQDIYDSLTGETLLIPQGSRLIGTYGNNDNGVSTGQTRLNAVFTRIIFPNGFSISLDNQKGTDSSGYPGLSDQVDTHSSSLYRSAFLTSALAALAGSASNGSGSDNRSAGQEAVSTGIGNILNVGSKIIDKQLNVQPTITIRPGTQFTVFINKDLILQAY